MTEVIMPKMGDGMEEGTLLEWLKKDGEKVKSGEIIGNIQTDKATLELEAPGSGILTGFLVQIGATVPVGQPIAAILKDGEKLPAGWGSGKASPSSAAETPKEEVKAAPAEPAKTEIAPHSGSDRVKASPLAKKIAAEKGIDLNTVQGSGPGGRIIEKDVTSAPAKVPASQPVVQVAASAEDQKIAMSKLRQITAQRTAQSKQQVPHYYVTVEVDVEKILAMRSQFEAEESGKVSINDFVVKATVKALQDMPHVNATFADNALTQFGAIHIGIAAAIEDGLTVPVLKNAGTLSLRQISGRVRDLVGRARENKLSLDELSGSTFSISNMWMLNVDNFLAIINQPNSGILAISSVRKKAVVDEHDHIVVRSRMNITCSLDHRVTDGAVGAAFANRIKDYLENPTRLLD
jgi:pyruvate dehydrogenase E2 component (dihydrolipoamide acetyltransferase)